MSELEALADLFRRYLHEDWAIDGDTPWDVVDEFICDEPQLAARLPTEINVVLSRQPTEEQLRHLVHDELICSYRPTADGWTYRAWLTAVADRVGQPPVDRRDQVDHRAQVKSHLVGLERLLHTYFHQDWPDDYPDPWDAVDEFIQEEPQLAAKLPAEVNRVLQECSTEAQLKELVEGLYFGYYIEADGWTYRGWLTAVSDRVRKATAA